MNDDYIYYGPGTKLRGYGEDAVILELLNPITCSSVELHPPYQVHDGRQPELIDAFNDWCEEHWRAGGYDRDPLTADPYRLLGGTDGST